MIAEGLFSYQLGGSERVGVDLALEFTRRGYRVVCFALYDSDGPMRAELERAGIRCLDLNYEKLRGLSRRVAYQWTIWRMLREEGVTALHVHHAGALIHCGIPAMLRRLRAVVMTEHGLHQLRERPSYRRSARFYCRFATAITVVEPTQAEYFRSVLRVPWKKLHYLANGVRIPERTALHASRARRDMGVSALDFVFMYVGRLNAVKDLGTLLTAFAELPEDVLSRARLLLVGDGPERAMLEAKRDALLLSGRVTFLGARGDVSEVLAAADAFVMSSKTEGLPMALLEAMAAGVPCVATAVGGIPDLFGQDRGVAVPAQSAPELATAMAMVARSTELRTALATNALANIKRHYDLEAIVDCYLGHLGLPPNA